MNFRAVTTSKPLFAALLLACLTYFWLINTFIKVRVDIAAEDMVVITGLTAAALVAEILILFLTKRFVLAIFPLLGLLNTYFVYVVLSSQIGGMALWLQIAICVSIAALYFVVLDTIWRGVPLRKWVALGAPLFVLLYAAAGAWFSTYGFRAGFYSTPSPPIRMVTFAEKPNIYFLSFDALLPESMAKKYLKLDAPAYIDVLRRHGAYFIPNMFSDLVPTKWAMGNVLKMVPNLDSRNDDLVTGRRLSPLREILHKSGYTVHFTFPVSFFGSSKGPYLDRYHVHAPYSSCDFLSDSRRRWGFFGYCWLRYGAWLESEAERKISPADKSYALVKAVATNKATGPQFYMDHFLSPEHTSSDYIGLPKQWEQYRARYARRSKEIAILIERELAEIQMADPSAIVFIYGDHGAWTSRPVSFEDNKEFFVQDRFGTMGALIGADRCRRFIAPPAGEHFQTIARVVVGLVQCLAGGESPLTKAVDYGLIQQIGRGVRFEDYVYE